MSERWAADRSLQEQKTMSLNTSRDECSRTTNECANKKMHSIQHADAPPSSTNNKNAKEKLLIHAWWAKTQFSLSTLLSGNFRIFQSNKTSNHVRGGLSLRIYNNSVESCSMFGWFDDARFQRSVAIRHSFEAAHRSTLIFFFFFHIFRFISQLSACSTLCR